MDQAAVRRVYGERVRRLGSDGFRDEESGSPLPELYKVPALKKLTDNSTLGETWEGPRHGRHVRVWRGTKWFRLADEVRVSGPALQVEVKGRRGQWLSEAGFAASVLAAHEAGPGSVSVQSGPDGVRVRRRLA